MHADTYFDIFMGAIPTARLDDYRRHIADTSRLFRKHGALNVVECWGDDVPEGKLTSMPMAVKCQADETVAVGWVIWPSKAVRDAGWKAFMDDPAAPKDMPFDGQRMIYGGFALLLDER